MAMPKRQGWLGKFTALAIAIASPGVALAQSCALCYTQAGGSGSRMIAALRSGILILVIPPMLICIGIGWMAYKKRNQFNEEPPAHPKKTNLAEE